MTHIEGFLADPKALIIAEPWATLIVSGKKDWEMRSRNTMFRGLFAIAQKGTGRLIGVAELHDCSHELSDQERRDNQHHHQVDPEAFKTPGFDKYRTAWKLRNMQIFDSPIPYAPRNGAVSWVKLTAEEAGKIKEKITLFTEATPTLQSPKFAPTPPKLVIPTPPHRAPDPMEKPVAAPVLKPVAATTTSSSAIPTAYQTLSVPIAADGTVFSPQLCNKKGTYQVGPKGSEEKFQNFIDALQHLEKIPTAYWRRPNPKGNWGAVKAKDWVKLADHWT